MASAGSVMLRSQFTKSFVERLAYVDEILFENFDAPSLTYTQVFNVRDSSRAYEEIHGIAGFGQFPEKPEGSGVEYDRLLQGYNVRFKHKTYAKGYQISFEAMQDDLDGAISNAGPALSRVARNSIETEAFSDFNTGFGATTTPDGQALFAAAHPLVGGGTFGNLVSADFDQGSLETALNIYDDMRDDRNQLIEGDPSIILHPKELRWVVNEVLKSQLRSDTANNTINVVNQLGLTPVMSKYLTGDDDWFLLSAPDRHRLLFYWRMEPISDHTLDFDSGNMKTKMTYRMTHGPADWRNMVGGQGQ